MEEKRLEVSNLLKQFGSKNVVNGLSFSVNAGEIVGLLGPNGAGKTTAFYMTIGLIAADSGTVNFEGHDVSKLAMHKRASMGMGYLAQEPSVFRSLSVEDNILCILENMPLNKTERLEKLESSLEDLDLIKHRKKKASSLSGGERRRLEISRALVTKPSLLLLDEPFANIDPISIQNVKKLITMLAKKGISILITDHNAREIFSIVDRSYIVVEGRAKLSGSVEELVNNEEAKEIYLGQNFKL